MAPDTSPPSPTNSKKSVIASLFGRSKGSSGDKGEPTRSEAPRKTRAVKEPPVFVEVSLPPPRSKPISSLSTSSFGPPSVHSPTSPYSPGPSLPSSSSLNTYSSSFASLVPDTANYNYEFERLRIAYKRSEERLRLEKEINASERALFERDREERERRHREEIDALRRQYGQSGRSAGDDKGKRKQ